MCEKHVAFSPRADVFIEGAMEIREDIVATARLRDATVITKDTLIREYPHVKSTW